MKSRILWVGLTACAVNHAGAADWSFDPRVAASGTYNDNINLTNSSVAEVSVSGGELDAQLLISAESPRSYLRLTPRLRSTFYPSESEREADDQFVRFATGFKTRRTETTLNANWSDVTMLGEYFPSAVIREDDQLGEPNPGEGVVQVGPEKNRQELLEVRPAMVFDLTERQSLEVSLGYLDAQYDIRVQGETEDYSSTVGAVKYGMELSQTAQLSFRGRYSIYDPAVGSTTAAYGLDAEWANKVSDTSQVYVRAGGTHAESGVESDGAKTWDTGFTGGMGVRWAFEVSQVFFDLNHDLRPSSAGDYVTSDQLRAEWIRRISPITDMSLGARWIRESASGNDGDFEDRSYATGSIGIYWRLARQWSLAGSYTYQWQEYEEWTSNAQSNGLNLGIVWEPNRR